MKAPRNDEEEAEWSEGESAWINRHDIQTRNINQDDASSSSTSISFDLQSVSESSASNVIASRNEEECEWSENESAWAPRKGTFTTKTDFDPGAWTRRMDERLKQGLICFKAQGWEKVAEHVGGGVSAALCRERMSLLLKCSLPSGVRTRSTGRPNAT